jgi:predicted metal-dependent enzyme (double-stranded beta helix superfamily)
MIKSYQYQKLSTLFKKLKKHYHPRKHNLSRMSDHMSNYCGSDWKKYVKFSDTRYTRTILAKTRDFEFVIICWKKGQTAPIHNHPAKGCLVKILTGRLKETLFKKRRGKLYKIRTDLRHKKQVSYMDNTRGYHDVLALEDTVSLHIYSPANYKPRFIL